MDYNPVPTDEVAIAKLKIINDIRFKFYI